MIRICFLLFIFYLSFAQSFLDSYTSYDELVKEIKTDGLKYKTIAKTKSGYNLDLLQFGEDNAPAIFILGNLDGSYPSATELSMNIARKLAKGEIDRKGKTIYLLPMPNPEATNALFSKISEARETNLTASDDDYDQAIDEDGFNDLNKDGIISQIRIKNPLGDYKENKSFPNLLSKIDLNKNETGNYTILSEGFDDDKDDKINEDPVGGTDLNKNFTYNYEYFGLHAGKNQASETEVKAIIDFIESNPNILVTIHFSKYNNMNVKWKANTKKYEDYARPLTAFDKMMLEDADSYDLLSSIWEKDNKWKTKVESSGSGTFHEWSYFHAGRWSIAVNAWDHSNIKLDSTFKAQDKMTKEEKLFHDAGTKKLNLAFVDWKRIKHPDFPKQEVDVGGFHLAYMNNPERSIIDSTKVEYFVESVADLFPKIEVSELKVTKLKKDLYRVELELINNGKLPSQSKMAEVSGWMHPVRVVWDIDKKKIVSGKKKTLLKPIAGFAGKQKLEWLIHSESLSKTDIRIESPVIGKITKTVRFGD
jgi:hypothetical protein